MSCKQINRKYPIGTRKLAVLIRKFLRNDLRNTILKSTYLYYNKIDSLILRLLCL